MMTFNEELRPEAESTISQIQKLGLLATILTGDSKPVSRMVQQKLPNVAFQTGLLPEQKVKIIESSRMSEGGTVMVGDGIKDAPALAMDYILKKLETFCKFTGFFFCCHPDRVNIFSSMTASRGNCFSKDLDKIFSARR